MSYCGCVDEAAMLRLSDRWWNEIWRDGEFAVADEILTDPFVRHSGTGTAVVSRSQYKGSLAEFQRTLCRPQTTIDDRVVSGDRVWTRATSRGFNRETGETSVLTWMLVQRMTNDRIAEHWVLTLRGVDWSA
jgi:predicted SnoaL-like aldol condensation-catalyzing enzyme